MQSGLNVVGTGHQDNCARAVTERLSKLLWLYYKPRISEFRDGIVRFIPIFILTASLVEMLLIGALCVTGLCRGDPGNLLTWYIPHVIKTSEYTVVVIVVLKLYLCWVIQYNLGGRARNCPAQDIFDGLSAAARVPSRCRHPEYLSPATKRTRDQETMIYEALTETDWTLARLRSIATRRRLPGQENELEGEERAKACHNTTRTCHGHKSGTEGAQ